MRKIEWQLDRLKDLYAPEEIVSFGFNVLKYYRDQMRGNGKNQDSYLGKDLYIGQIDSGLMHMTMTYGIARAAEMFLYDMGANLPFLQKQLIPVEIAKLMGALCGHQLKKASVWAPYCGVGELLTYVDMDDSSHIICSETNRTLADFAESYVSLMKEGTSITVISGGPASKSETDENFDVIISSIPLWRSFESRENSKEFVWRLCRRLKPGGKAVILIPNGLLFRGGKDLLLRKMLIGNHLLKGIIYLPNRVLGYTTAPRSILILKNDGREEDITLIDALRQKRWIDSGRKVTLTEAALRDIPELMMDENAGKHCDAVRRVWPDDEAYRLDSQYHFHRGASAGCEADSITQVCTKEDLWREVEQAMMEHREACDRLMMKLKVD